MPTELGAAQPMRSVSVLPVAGVWYSYPRLSLYMHHMRCPQLSSFVTELTHATSSSPQVPSRHLGITRCQCPIPPVPLRSPAQG